MSGIYEFELWGSPGGIASGDRGTPSKGGYTKFYIHIDRLSELYCFVGGSGSSSSGNVTLGGWNGGGSVTTCLTNGDAGSGGGMTHVSYSDNPASDSNGLPFVYWNPEGTIDVAGGGGGSSWKAPGGDGGGVSGGTGQGYEFNNTKPHMPYGGTQTSGYKQGIGESNYNSGGGGGGWYGGYSTGHKKQTHGLECRSGGGGGSGYICEAGKQTKYTHLNKCLAGYEDIPVKPNVDDSDKGRHGYIRINLYERD